MGRRKIPKAMARNTTFCSSSVPNHDIVRGTRVAIGTYPLAVTSGSKAERALPKAPMRMPSGNATASASAYPRAMRRRLSQVWSNRVRSSWSLLFKRSRRLSATSVGLGRITGPITRSSTAPRVTIHQRETRNAIGKRPRIIEARRGTLLRMPTAHLGIIRFHQADINHDRRPVSTARARSGVRSKAKAMRRSGFFVSQIWRFLLF